MTTSDDLIKNSGEYISSPEAISLTGYTRSHIAYLSRTGKIDARLVGNLWYVNKKSLLSFVKNEETKREERKQRLAEQRRVEYQNGKTEAIKKSRVTFFQKVLKEISLLMFALLFVFSFFNLEAHNFVVNDSIDSIKEVTSPASVYSSIQNLPENLGNGIYNTREFLVDLFSREKPTDHAQIEAQPIPEGFVKTQSIIEGIVQDRNVKPEGGQTTTNIIVTGISQQQLTEALDERSKQIIEHVQAITNVNKQQIINNYTTIAHTNKIDNLGSVTITNSTITGSNISGGTGSFTRLEVTNTGTTTFAGGINLTGGCLAVNGTCISSGGGGSSFGQAWEVNSNGLLAPTTTIAIHFPGALFASSSAQFDGTVTADNFIGTSTATSTLSGGLSTVRLNTTATSTLTGLRVSGGLNIGSITGFLKATAGVVATAAIDLASDITGILGVSNGGTGQSNIQANTILIGNGTSAVATTSAGTNGQVLALENGIPTWIATTTLSTISGTLAVTNGGTGATSLNDLITLGTHTTGNYLATLADAGGLTVANSGSESAAVTVALDLTNSNVWTGLQSFSNSSTTLASFTGTTYFGGTATSTFDSAGVLTLVTALAETSGGTGQSTYSTGDILYADGSNSLTKLTAGTNGEVLKLSGGVPSWSTDLTSGGGGGAGVWATTTNEQAIYPADSTDIVILGATGTTTHNEILQVTGSSYFSGNIFASSSLRVDNSVLGNIFVASSTSATSTFAGGLTVDSTDFVVDPDSGMTGLGILSPTARLDVRAISAGTGIAKFRDDTRGAEVLIQAITGAISVIKSGVGDSLQLSTNNSTTQGIHIDTAGNVGIATTSMSDVLSVEGDVSFSEGTNYRSFYWDATNGMLGIGTSSPYAKLSVVGETVSEYFTATSTTATSTFAGGFAVETNGLVYDYSTNNVGIGTADPSKLFSVETDTTTSEVIAQFKTSGIFTQDSKLGIQVGRVLDDPERLVEFGYGAGGAAGVDPFFYVETGDGSGTNTKSEKFRITHDGYVGIGTTTPTSPGGVDQFVHIAGSSASVVLEDTDASTFEILSAGNNLKFAAGASTLMTIESSGNVGIGDTTPDATLDVVGTIRVDSTSGTGAIDLAMASNVGTIRAVNTTSDTLDVGGADVLTFSTFSGSWTERMRIANNGNVGIGTTTPDAKLEVRYPGSAGTSEYSFKTYGYDGDSYFGVSSDGNNSANVALYSSAAVKQFEVLGHTGNTYIKGSLGIGTTSPSGTLAVEGTIFTSGNVTVGNGTGKLTVGTIDPVYEIGDTKYSTYVSGMIGQKEETTGVVAIDTPAVDANGNEGYVYEIDFDEQETASDLWLFAKASAIRKHIDQLVVLLTSEGGADVWYVIDEAENKVIFLSDTPTTVSWKSVV